MSDGQDLHPPTPKQTCQLCIVQRLSTLLQVDQDDAYKMGTPLVSINLGTEEPKLGDVAITAAHRAIRGHFLSQKDSLFGGFYKAQLCLSLCVAVSQPQLFLTLTTFLDVRVFFILAPQNAEVVKTVSGSLW